MNVNLFVGYRTPKQKGEILKNREAQEETWTDIYIYIEIERKRGYTRGFGKGALKLQTLVFKVANPFHGQSFDVSD